MIQIVAIEKVGDDLHITDAAKRVYECKSADDLWGTLLRISESTDMPAVQTEKAPRKGRRFSRRTTRQQEEDLRKIGGAIISRVPEAAPAFNMARDMLQQLGTLGRKR